MTAKTPTNLKVIQGNPGKRANNKQEPDPDYLEDLTAPTRLKDDARAVWDELAPQFAKAKLIAVIDIEEFANACICAAKCRQLYSRMNDDTLTDGQRTDAENKFLGWDKRCSAHFAKFGASPLDRSRISIQPQLGLEFGADGKDSKAGKYF